MAKMEATYKVMNPNSKKEPKWYILICYNGKEPKYSFKSPKRFLSNRTKKKGRG